MRRMHSISRPTPGPATSSCPGVHRRHWGRPPLRLVLLVVGLVLLTLTISDSPASAETVDVVALAGDISTVLSNLRNWLMGILALIATVFLTVGGVRYVTAGGDPTAVEKAKSAFKSAGIGYALAALAPLVVDVLKQIVGA